MKRVFVVNGPTGATACDLTTINHDASRFFRGEWQPYVAPETEKRQVSSVTVNMADNGEWVPYEVPTDNDNA